MIETIKIYQPPNKNRENIYKLIKRLTRELINSRELIWQLFLRDFKARYKQSLIGWGWIFIIPLVGVGTFIILNQSGVLRIENTSVPYPIYGLLGFSLWQIFASGLSSTSGSIVSAGSFIAKINFSKEALVFSSIGQVIVEFLIRMVLLVIIFLLFGILPSFGIILLPFLVIPLILLTLGLGFIASLLNAVIRDVQNIINVVLGFFLFLMPIMYTPSQNSIIYQVNKYNPLYFLISVPREIIISGNFTNIYPYLISSLIAIFIFISGWYIFTKAQGKIAEAI